jgi:hypothetical protein
MTDRTRAERALGRRLKRNEHVHHHTLSQLVICTKEYHTDLHRIMRERGIPCPMPARGSRVKGSKSVWLHPTLIERYTVHAQRRGYAWRPYISIWLEQIINLLDQEFSDVELLTERRLIRRDPASLSKAG